MKHFVYITIFIIGLNFTSYSQNNNVAKDGSGVKMIKLYPIPATSVVNFDFVKGYEKNYSFQIYNFTGKKVYELKNPPPKINLLLNDFSRGFYYYQLLDKNGKLIETVRFLVIK